MVIFFLELLALFFLSRSLTKNFSRLLYHMTRHEKHSVSLMALIFLPGTFVHELAHYVTALLLGVHAGKMEFVPEIQGDTVKMGSVSIAKCDPVRRFLIGVAPVVWGVGIILGMMYFVTLYGIFTNLWASGGILLAIFVVGNTMYSSRRDMEGALGLFAIVFFLIALVGGFFWYSGTSIPEVNLSFLNLKIIYAVFETGWKYLLVPIVVDVVILGFLGLLFRK